MLVEKAVNVTEAFNMGEVIPFGVKDASLIFDMLCTKLYKDARTTMVQEYMCNARDAHREIDSDRPIEVTLPTALFPYLSIRDYGPGISKERMSEVFIFLGESTKSSSDKQTGGFGIGAKIAWAYTDSFTIITVVDGVRSEYLAFMGDGNIGALASIEESETEEENGTTIRIKIDKYDFSYINKAVDRMCFFWKVQPIVHNRDAGSDYEPYIHTGDSMCRMQCPNFISTGTAPIVVVDGVPYTVSDIQQNMPNFQYYYSHYAVPVFFVGNSDVDLAVNRENIRWTERTKAALTEIYEEHLQVVQQEVEKLKGFSTLSDLIEQGHKLSGILIVGTVEVPVVDEYFSLSVPINGDINFRIGGLGGVSDSYFEGHSFFKDRSTLSGVRGVTSARGQHTFSDAVSCVIAHSEADKWPNRDSVLAYLNANNINRVTVVNVPYIDKCEKLWALGFGKLLPVVVDRTRTSVVRSKYRLLTGNTIDDVEEGSYCYFQFKDRAKYVDSRLLTHNRYVTVEDVQYKVIVATQPQVLELKQLGVPHISDLFKKIGAVCASQAQQALTEMQQVTVDAVNKYIQKNGSSNVVRAHRYLFEFIINNYEILNCDMLKQYAIECFKHHKLNTAWNDKSHIWSEFTNSVRSIKKYRTIKEQLGESLQQQRDALFEKYSLLQPVLDNYHCNDRVLCDMVEWVNMKS